MSTVGDSLNQLKEMGLLTEDDLSVCSKIADAEDVSVDSLVDLLVEQGRLTKYQASVICHRRTGWLKIGDYIIQDMLGKGGMGVVYKAYDSRMHREVAIKMLLESGQQSDDKIERFRREAIAAARMNHPNIVTAYTANEHEGYPYLVMEYVKGRDLGSLVKKGGPLPVGEAVNYILQTAVGMAYAHSRHIIHRDLKPSNLLLATPDDSDIRPGQYSRVKILDMGLARLTQPQGEVVSPALEGSDLSATGMLMGTVDYMAPEQAMDTKRADHRSDIYSLGCTLYYLLTKKPVYTGSNLLERISAHLKADVPSLREARPEAPEELDAVFQKMVAKKPRDRYQSMQEAVEALQRIDRQLSGFGSSVDIWQPGLVPGEGGEFPQPGSSYGSKSGLGTQGSAPTIASGSGPMGNLPGSSYGSTAYAEEFPSGGTITQTGMPMSQKLIVVVLLGLMAGTMVAIYNKSTSPNPEDDNNAIVEPPPPPMLELPAFFQPAADAQEKQITLLGKTYRCYDVIELDVSQLPMLPREIVFADAIQQLAEDQQGLQGETAPERQQDLVEKVQSFEENFQQILADVRRADVTKAEELIGLKEQIPEKMNVIGTLLDNNQLELAMKHQDEVLKQLKSMSQDIGNVPAIAEAPIRLAKGEMLVRFRLIEEQKDPEARPFYIMETKVWSDLFRLFAQTHPHRLAEETYWAENQPGMLPAYYMSPIEAYACAQWMGGDLPTAEQWDAAAGFYLDNDQKADYVGPYRQPDNPDQRLNVAIYGESQPVDIETDDISPLGIRHMAGNGLELTRTTQKGVIDETRNPIGPETKLVVRGCSHRQFGTHLPLTYETMREIVSRPNATWGVSWEASDEYSFRVVWEIPVE